LRCLLKMPRKAKGAKRRGKSRKGSALTKTIKSVIKKMTVKPELKEFDDITLGASLGQVNLNAAAWNCVDITPTPAQGDGHNERIGSSMRLYDASIKMQFIDMANRAQPMRIRVEIFLIKGTPISTATFVTDAYEFNDFVGSGGTIQDYNSDKQDNYKKMYKRIFVKQFVHTPDNFSGQSMVTTKNWRIKFPKTLIQFENDTTTVNSGQLIMVMTTDGGNIHTGSVSTLAYIPTVQVSSGVTVSHATKFRYTDV